VRGRCVELEVGVRCGSQGEDPALRSAHTADDEGTGAGRPLVSSEARSAPRGCHCEQVLLVGTRANGTYLPPSFRGVRWLELPAES
jgi:hypothetical protein